MVRNIVIAERKIPIVDYLLEKNARGYYQTLRRMTAQELHQAKDKEWSGRKRAWLLVKIEKRLAELAVAKETLVIMRNARKPKSTCGRLPLTIKQVEAKIAALLMAPDTQSNRNKIYWATRLLRKKRMAYVSKAQKLAALNEHKRLTAAQYKDFQRELGDHDCTGRSCVLCGGQGLE